MESMDLLGLGGGAPAQVSAAAPSAPAAGGAQGGGWTCPSCQKQRTGEMLFCPNCGQRRPEEAPPAVAATPVPAAAPQPTAAPQSTPLVVLEAPAPAPASPSKPVRTYDEPVIAYPSALESAKVPAQSSSVFKTTAEREVVPPARQAAAAAAPHVALRVPGAAPASAPPSLEQLILEVPDAERSRPSSATERRFLVRCEGRWRIRSSPTLTSRILGTMAPGMVVVSDDPGPDPETKSGKFTGSLWVQIKHFEAPVNRESTMIDVKPEAGPLYVLRRNAIGYGLYELGMEPLNGNYIYLSDERLFELQTDARRVTNEDDEDVSMTWRILEAAESVSGWFSGWRGEGEDVSGHTEVLDQPSYTRVTADELFQAKQREQVKHAAAALHHVTRKLVLVLGLPRHEEALGSLPKDLRSRFLKLRARVLESASVAPSLAHALQSNTGPTSPAGAAAAPPVSATAASDPAVASVAVGGAEQLQSDPFAGGSAAADQDKPEIARFLDVCGRLARSGPWPEMANELRNDFVAFSHKYTKDLEQQGINLARMLRTAGAVPTGTATQSPSAGAQGAGSALLDFTDSSSQQQQSAFKAPLLPPPRKPSKGLSLGP